MQSKPALYARISAALVALGWDAIENPLPSGMAQLTVKTAVGDKYAIATEFWPSDTEAVTLNGDYQSEGRNALSTMFARIPLDCTDSQLQEIVRKYDASVRDAVSRTYAARLYDRTPA